MLKLRASLESFFLRYWYRPTLSPVLWILVPFSYLYRLGVFCHRLSYQSGCLSQYRAPKPVVVIGNLTMGGTGKTPLVIQIAKQLIEQGWRVGVITRGYGVTLKAPRVVRRVDDAGQVGDEALLLAQQISGLVVACADRTKAARWLCEHSNVDIILSDDGLQHWSLKSDIDICVIDGHRQLGNGWCFPAGPLREPMSRLADLRFQVMHPGSLEDRYAMQLKPVGFYSVATGEPIDVDSLKSQPLQAMAGIGYPERFFQQLRELGFSIQTRVFPDHHPFIPEDLQRSAGMLLLMTEKDAVKCRAFADKDCYFLKVRAQLSDAFSVDLKELIDEMATRIMAQHSGNSSICR